MISELHSHPHLIPQLVDGFFSEWPAWCARAGRPAVERIFQSGADAALPVVLVAHQGDRALGTIALRPFFAEEPMPETPWVRQLYVFPGERGRGIDRALIAAVERRAAALGYGHLYAATNRIERLLARRGWEPFASVEHEQAPLVWMRKAISAR